MNYKTRVLLIDDQPIIFEAVKTMLNKKGEIDLLYCQNPLEALNKAKEFRPTVILQDLIMPEMDGLDLVKKLREDTATKAIPLIVLSSKEDPALKAKAFQLGANDYLVKIPDEVELIARILYHSNSYTHMLQRDEAYARLQRELDDAAYYVRKLLPPPIQTDRLSIHWNFFPSASLGGDAFGYEWLDKEHLALFLLDVCGHGVGAALLSISLMNALRGQKLSHCDFYDPASVLAALNSAYKMEAHNNMFFTIWYGVLDQKTGRLRYSSAGHPPALLLDRICTRLDTQGLAIGVSEDSSYTSQEISLPARSSLYLFSDGTFEIPRPDGSRLSFDEFVRIVNNSRELEAILTKIRSIQNQESFNDDYSILRLDFFTA